MRYLAQIRCLSASTRRQCLLDTKIGEIIIVPTQETDLHSLILVVGRLEILITNVVTAVDTAIGGEEEVVDEVAAVMVGQAVQEACVGQIEALTQIIETDQAVIVARICRGDGEKDHHLPSVLPSKR